MAAVDEANLVRGLQLLAGRVVVCRGGGYDPMHESYRTRGLRNGDTFYLLVIP